MEKYQDKYRIDSNRLKHWDYRSAGVYFITTNTHNGEPCFGDVFDGKMQLSKIGIIADICWFELTNHFDHLELGEYIIMPNHVHGILILHDDFANGIDNRNRAGIDDGGDGGDGCGDGGDRDDACIVSTDNPADKQSSVVVLKNSHMANISPKDRKSVV